jgi:tetratricopeptide (TPR) repeat protein
MTPDDYFQRAVSRFRKEDFPGAESFCSQAIAAGLNTGDVYYLRGKAQQFAGNLPGAIEDYTRAIEIDSTHALAYERRGEARRIMGDEAGGKQDTLSAIQAYPICHQQFLHIKFYRANGQPVFEGKVPAEYQPLWFRTIEFYQEQAMNARYSGDGLAELVNMQIFMIVGGLRFWEGDDPELRIQALKQTLKLDRE